MASATEIQKQYYERTAAQYDEMHTEPEHVMALHMLAAYIEVHRVRSILDVGAGTGRAMRWLKQRFPELVVKGVEPIDSLRRQAFISGVLPSDLVQGDGYALPFRDGSFDLVCAFAVLHHVRDPERMIGEMSRVARQVVAVSDSNFLGQGARGLRLVKLALFLAFLWPAANWVKTGGRHYTLSEGDGVAYSYSVFGSVATLRRRWKTLRIQTTRGDSDGRIGSFLTASHLLVVASDKLG